jgi:hypothetical protein
MHADKTDILLVPLIDVNWLVYAPFDPGRDFRVDPPNVGKSIGETREIHRLLLELTGGKYILTPHAGTYCRTGYYEGEMLDVYREAVAGGAEVAVHLHEEIKGAGTRYADEGHMRQVFADADRRLRDAGIRPVAYRGGHNAYAPFMNAVLQDHDIFVDCSSAPGMEKSDREAIWTHSLTSGYYLPENPRAPMAGQPRSSVFEIPIGSDGLGASYSNILHIEQSEIDNLLRVWNVLREGARREGAPRIVHCLFHTGSMGEERWVERLKRFLDLVPRNGGSFVTTAEAKAYFDAGRAERAA